MLTATLGAAALTLTGGAAYALAASSSGTITVCVRHNGGALYKAAKCVKHDKQLSWNKQGVTGATGPQGTQGRQGPPGTVDTSTFYTKSQSDSRYLQVTQAVSGQSAVGSSGYGLSGLTTLRQLTVDSGPTARHVLIEGDGDVWSAAGQTCDGFMQLSWDGKPQSATNTSATAPVNGSTNGRASLTTSAMLLLSPGTHVIELSGNASSSGCIGFQDSRLNVVLLSN
jgi:hypothetical protein